MTASTLNLTTEASWPIEVQGPLPFEEFSKIQSFGAKTIMY